MKKYKKYKYHLAALFTVMVWGATFVSTKVLIANSVSPAEIFLIRFFLAYICIWPLSLAQNHSPKSRLSWPERLRSCIWAKSWRDEMSLLVAGVSGGSIYFLTENIALEYAPASNVSLIVCTVPIWTALLMSTLYRNERMSQRQILSSAIAFAGMVLVVLNGHFILNLSLRGDILALSSAMSWVVYSLIIKRIGDRYASIFITRKVFFYGLLTILPYFYFEPFNVEFEVLARPVVWVNLLFLGVIASMLCFVLWNSAMHHLGTVRTTNYIYINPLVTIITAWAFIGERITIAALAGAALIVFGMWRSSSGGR